MGDASAVLWRVLLAAAPSRSRHEGGAAPADPPGMAHPLPQRSRCTRGPRAPAQAAERLSHHPNRAVPWVAANSRRGRDADRPSAPRAAAIAGHVRQIQQRADASAGRWSTAAGPTDRRVLDVLCLLALQGLTAAVEADIRRLGLLAGIGRETARTGLLRLAPDGWITQHSAAEGPRAACWNLGPAPVIHSTAAEGRSQVDT